MTRSLFADIHDNQRYMVSDIVSAPYPRAGYIHKWRFSRGTGVLTRRAGHRARCDRGLYLGAKNLHFTRKTLIQK